MWSKELHTCQVISLEPPGLEIDTEGNSTCGTILSHAPTRTRLPGSSMKSSPSLEITEHNLALAVLKLSIEPGLADSGKMKAISMPFLRTVIIENRVSPVSNPSFPDRASVLPSLWEQGSYFIHNVYLLATCSPWTSTLLKLFPFLRTFPNETTSLQVRSWQPCSLTLENTFRHSVPARRSPVTINSKQNTHLKAQRSDET